MMVGSRNFLDQLDSPRYEQRDAASRTLAEDLAYYLADIQKAYQADGISLEVRSRLKRILQTYRASSAHELDGLLSELNLVDDAEYLVNILHRVPEEQMPLVTHRLTQLTGREFASDVAAWQRWLELYAE